MPAEDERRAAVERCGNLVVYRMYRRSGAVKLHGYNSCGRPRLCGFCAIRRSAQVAGRYVERIQHVLAEQPHLVPVFVTLTQETGDDLGERFQNIQAALGGMVRRRRNRALGKGRPTVLSAAAGGVGAIEIKRGSRSGKWHPHYHGVWLLEEFIPQAELAAEWAGLVGQGSSIAWIRQVHDKWRRLSTVAERIGAGCCEALKYSVKFDSMHPEDVLHAESTLHRKQMLRPFGNLVGVKLPARLEDEPEAGPWVQWCYKFMAGRYRLLEVEHGGEVESMEG